MEEQRLPHNLAFDLVRVTEATALAAGRWIGVGNREALHQAATEAMAGALNSINIDGHIVYGEEGRMGEHSPLDTGKRVTITGITISRIEGGKVVEEWEEVDRLGLMQQLGVVPPMGQGGD